MLDTRAYFLKLKTFLLDIEELENSLKIFSLVNIFISIFFVVISCENLCMVYFEIMENIIHHLKQINNAAIFKLIKNEYHLNVSNLNRNIH